MSVILQMYDLNVNTDILEVYVHVPIFYDNYTADGTEHIHDTERVQITARENDALMLCYGFTTNIRKTIAKVTSRLLVTNTFRRDVAWVEGLGQGKR